MKGFVYSSKQNLSADKLKKLLDELALEPSYYFLRSAHAVSGICRKLLEEFLALLNQDMNFKIPISVETRLIASLQGFVGN